MPDVPPDPSTDGEPAAQPLRSVHTSNFPELLEQLGISLLVTTYQAGRLVLLRSHQGVINTHFRTFDKPMGLAVTPNRIALGAATSIWEFHNLPAVCQKLNRAADGTGATDGDDAADAADAVQRPSDAVQRPSDGEAVSVESRPRHDACFLPRLTHWTGDIQVHEMAWVGDEAEADLWFVNTRFSCLCRRSDVYNFDPVWRPPFLDRYLPADCCHLNGLGLRDGKPRYVTALGQSSEPEGWRANKRDGGVLMDVVSNEMLARGLSMPHSPRWYAGRLWVLESGTGGFGWIDLQQGRYHSVCQLAGFTRGLSFAGPLAFVGLSQIRESAVFGGVPIAEKALEERNCGVWVIHLETGQPVAFLRFEDAVQEIFAVEVLPSRYPEVVNDDLDLLSGSFELPDQALAEVPAELRAES